MREAALAGKCNTHAHLNRKGLLMSTAFDATATTIPLVDLRGKTLVDLLLEHEGKAHALVAAATKTSGSVSRAVNALALRLADRASHSWLKRTGNPYLKEIEAYAEIVNIPGAFALNLSYEWGCTSGAFSTGDSATLLRILDWGLPELGKCAIVARQDSAAGDFYNVTWPGLSGMFNAMAPGRFAAALNQAPMRRHGSSLARDRLRNRIMVNANKGLPPAHLLRMVFEQATSYGAAREMLANTPVCLPVIYILSGRSCHEGCVIERLENTAIVSDLSGKASITSTNHFNSALANRSLGWTAPGYDSLGRYRASRRIDVAALSRHDFTWLKPPIVNELNRLALIANAQNGRLTVQGFEGEAAVTKVFQLSCN
jgi:hypothetical protein